MNALELANQTLAQAQAMNTAANENDWNKVQEIQALHSNTVAQLSAIQINNKQEANSIRELLIEVKQLNNDTELLAASKKETLVKEKQTMTKANKMQKALDALK
jgi:protein involved in polysaccharide export with SLBB domain